MLAGHEWCSIRHYGSVMADWSHEGLLDLVGSSPRLKLPLKPNLNDMQKLLA